MATVNGIKLKVGDRVRLKPFGLAKLTQSAELQKPSIAEEMEKYFGGTYVVDSVRESTLDGYPLISLDGVSYWVFHPEWVEEIIPEIDCDDCKHQPVQAIGVKAVGDECMSCISAGCKTLFEPRVDTKQQSALDTQVAGDHYKTMGIQPIQFAVANKLNSCQTLALRYLTRKKGDTDKIIEDRKKAIHMIQIEIEMIEKGAISFE